MEKIGVFGGTFDPVHMGHLLLAEQARECGELSQVVFMPACSSPFKVHKEMTGGQARQEMVRLAISGNPHFKLSELELLEGGISYTYDTLKKYKELIDRPVELFFITGTDAFISVDSWYAAENLLKEFSFIIGNRPGYREQDLKEKIEEVERMYGCRAITVSMPQIDISSTEIRRKIYEKKSIRYMVPESVEAYILNAGLYNSFDAIR